MQQDLDSQASELVFVKLVSRHKLYTLKHHSVYIYSLIPADLQVNAVFTQLFTIMGVYPVIYASLLLPAGRSGNKVRHWQSETLADINHKP